MLKVIDICIVFNMELLGTRYHSIFFELGMKPQMHLVEIATLSLYHVILRPTEIIKGANKIFRK